MPSATFRVTDPKAIRQAVAPGVRDAADAVMRDARAETPVRTGHLRAGWRLVRGRDVAYQRVTNDVSYARFVEYGTRHMPPAGMLGRAIARARTG